LNHTGGNLERKSDIGKYLPENKVNKTSALAITSFSPRNINAGTGSILTITGTDFGAVEGNVLFLDANTGGQGTLTNATAPESWTNTKIEVIVPTRAGADDFAGKGYFIVKTATGQEITSPGDSFNVRFNISNYSGNLPHLSDVSQQGGYLMLPSEGTDNNGVDFAGHSKAFASYKRALQSWRCNTLVNFEIGDATPSNSRGMDAENIIAFDNDAAPLNSGVLGIAATYPSPVACNTGITKINELDMIFRRNGTGGITWTFGPEKNSSQTSDFESVAVHEIGHQHQLGHIINPDKIMNFSLSRGTQYRILDPQINIDAGLFVLEKSTNILCQPMTIIDEDICALFPPTALFTSDKIIGCGPTTINFTSTSLGSPSTFTWDFGDGSPVSNDQNPSHSYSSLANYNVTLTVSNEIGSDSKTINNYIIITEAQTLPFFEDFETNEFPLNGISRTLTILEGDTIWERSAIASSFGNGTGSAVLANDETVFPVESNSLLTPPFDFSNVQNPKISFDVAYEQFYNDPTNRLTLFYSIDCGATYVELSYKKGTGDLATSQGIPQDYAGAGGNWKPFVPEATEWRSDTLSISELAGKNGVIIKFQRDQDGSDGVSNSLYIDNISVRDDLPIPTALFTSENQAPCINDSVEFLNESIFGTSYEWIFEDGSPATSELMNPKAVFLSIGSKKVTLITANSTGSDTVVMEAFIEVQGSSFIGEISYATQDICTGKEIVITLDSAVGAMLWEESLDGIIFQAIEGKTKKSLSYIPQDTVFIRAIAGNEFCGSDTSNIIQLNAIPTPTADFEPSFNPASTIAEITFSNTGALENTYKWYFGDGNSSTDFEPTHQYEASGVYTVSLVVKNNSVCSDSVVKEDLMKICAIGKIETITAEETVICGNKSAVLTTTGVFGNISWEESLDGIEWTVISGADSTTLKQPIVGTKFFRVITSDLPCASDTSEVIEINQYELPLVEFASSKTEVAEGEFLFFTNDSEEEFDYLWKFGDGGESEEYEPGYIYNKAGVYSVTLSASSENCTNQITKTDLITVTGISSSVFYSNGPSLNVYPNPNNGTFTIDFPEGIKINNAQLISIDGKVIFDFPSLKKEVNTPGPGVYFLRINSNFGTSINKIITQ
jgi:PKD repeat protein